MDNAPKKSLGQHWLYDKASLVAMCEVAELDEHDVVLEIGPGQGTLTEFLTEKAARVIAIELDEALAGKLAERVRADNLEVVTGDILQLDLTKLPSGYKVIANIPYYLTSNLIRLLSEAANSPVIAALLVQKEVARRVVAEPGDMSLLSTTAQFYWQVSLGREIPAELFTPPPKVDSQILILKQRSQPLFDVDTKKFFRLVRVGFAQRRKTLLNTLGAGLQLNRGEVKALCETAGIDPQRRAQTLSLQEWHTLYTEYNT